jgi:hypothetical protein
MAAKKSPAEPGFFVVSFSLYWMIIASAGQSLAESFTAFSRLGGTSGVMTSAVSFPILKTWGTPSVHKPQAVQRSASILTFIAGSFLM